VKHRGFTHAVVAAVFAVSGVVTTPSARADEQADAASGCSDAYLAPAPENYERVAAATVCLVNAERSKAGLPALGSNGSLAVAGTRMAGRMAREQFFSHDTPDGVNVLDRVMATDYVTGFEPIVVGENLGWGAGADGTPAAMVSGWMNSPEHRSNVLDRDYQDLGVGFEKGACGGAQSEGTYYVADFGTRRRIRAQARARRAHHRRARHRRVVVE
jgi:uncharacterized protein YkwD